MPREVVAEILGRATCAVEKRKFFAAITSPSYGPEPINHILNQYLSRPNDTEYSLSIVVSGVLADDRFLWRSIYWPSMVARASMGFGRFFG